MEDTGRDLRLVPDQCPDLRLAAVRSGASSGNPLGAVRVTGGAAVAGARGDAWLRVDEQEHERRHGRVVADLALLDVLGRLPLHRPVPLAALEPWELAALLSAPSWAVSLEAAYVQRVAVPPVTVGLVTCEGGTWRSLLCRAAAFRQFAPAAVLLPRRPTGWADLAWEADVAGVGVFVREDEAVVEVLAAEEPRTPRKAAHWRFEERAYRTWAVSA